MDRSVPVFTALLGLCIVSLAPAMAQTPVPTRTPTIDQSLEMRTVSSPRISPDGRHVVYEQSRTDWDANAFETDLWLADTVYPGSRTLTKAGVRALDQIAQEFRKAAASVRSARG